MDHDHHDDLDRNLYEVRPAPPEPPSIEEFLKARLNESPTRFGGVNNVETYDAIRRLEGMILDVIEWHKDWPVLMEQPIKFERLPDMYAHNTLRYELTQRIEYISQEEFKKRFGELPPTAPLLRRMAQRYNTHPDYNHEWDD